VQAYVGQERKTNPLLQACESGHLEIVQYLVEKCAANVETARGGLKEILPLHFACESGELDLVQYLVATCRVDVEEKDNTGNTALHKAAQSVRPDIVQHLVEKCGSNVEAKNDDQCTALHMVCDGSGADAIAVVKYFVDVCCVSVNAPNVQGETLYISQVGREMSRLCVA
jgi:ankyrin repeat protein